MDNNNLSYKLDVDLLKDIKIVSELITKLTGDKKDIQVNSLSQYLRLLQDEWQKRLIAKVKETQDLISCEQNKIALIQTNIAALTVRMLEQQKSVDDFQKVTGVV